MADKPGTDVAVFNPSDSAFPALFAEDGEGSIAEIMADNFGDDGFSVADLDRVKIPSGGGTAWEVPDEEPTRQISGIIIHKQPTRSFWFKGRGEGGEEDAPPDCYSPDGKAGVGVFGPGSESNRTGACETCPMNVFGSSTRGSGEGKACKEQMQLFLLREDAVLPLQVSLPPTSLKPFRKYMTRLASKGKSFMHVVTGIGLVTTKSNGQTYSVADLSTLATLEPAEKQKAREYGNTIRGFLEQAAAARAAQERQDDDTVPGSASGGNGDVWRSDEPPATEEEQAAAAADNGVDVAPTGRGGKKG